MSWVFQHSQATRGARLVLLAIANHADLHGRNSWASVAQLAEEAYLSERNTRYALRDLEQAGEVVQVGISPHRTHVYELPGMATLWEGASLAGATIAGGKKEQTRGQERAEKGASIAPEPKATIQEQPSSEPLDHFDEFWTVYPRKVGKPKAKAAYERALRRSSPEQILVGAHRYATDPNRAAEFTAHPTTWLNRDGWADDPLPERTRRRPAELTLDRMAREAMEGMNAERRSQGTGHGDPRALPG